MRVPLVVVTGFLGAGKTTLVNRLLARRAAAGSQGGRLGVVVNELGAVGIDGTLLTGAARQIELPGGCVCCVLGDDLDATLVDLCDATPDLAAIVLETTGVAEPLPIAWAVTKPGSDVAARVRLAAVVTLVDAEHFRHVRAVSAAVDAQVAYADVVLVTKAELAGEQAVAAALAEAAALAPRAQIRRGTTDEHAAWLDAVLGDPSLEPPSAGAAAGAAANAPLQAVSDPGHVHDEYCRHPDSTHGIDSVWVDMDDPVDIEELEDELAALPGHYVRIKGIVRGVDARSGTPVRGWFAFHRVGLRVSSEPVAAPAFSTGRAVALGPGVEAAPLAMCLQASVASDLLSDS